MAAAAELVTVYMGNPGEGLVFAPDGSGWARYTTGSGSYREPNWLIRFAKSTDAAPFAIREIRIGVLPGDGSKALRDLPLGRLEAAANQPETRARLDPLLPPDDRLAVPLPDESDESLFVDGAPWLSYTVAKTRSPKLKLKVPSTYRKPDVFYRQVADVFAYLSTVSTKPAVELAAANNVEVTSIHGWVKEARRRGFLPAGERSRRDS